MTQEVSDDESHLEALEAKCRRALMALPDPVFEASKAFLKQYINEHPLAGDPAIILGEKPMAQETVFEVCIIERPTVKDAEEGKSARIVLPPTAVVAKGTQDAPLVAALNAKIEIDPSRMEVLVRPFLGR